jgi:hypothetical protein
MPGATWALLSFATMVAKLAMRSWATTSTLYAHTNVYHEGLTKRVKLVPCCCADACERNGGHRVRPDSGRFVMAALHVFGAPMFARCPISDSDYVPLECRSRRKRLLHQDAPDGVQPWKFYSRSPVASRACASLARSSAKARP